MRRIIWAVAIAVSACAPVAPSASPRASLAAIASAPVMPSASPMSTTLLSLSGTGVSDTTPFTASGDGANLAYTFDCAKAGSNGHFALLFLDRTGVKLDQVNYKLATSGKDSSTVYLSNTAPPFHLAIDSDCVWSVIVSGTP